MSATYSQMIQKKTGVCVCIVCLNICLSVDRGKEWWNKCGNSINNGIRVKLVNRNSLYCSCSFSISLKLKMKKLQKRKRNLIEYFVCFNWLVKTTSYIIYLFMIMMILVVMRKSTSYISHYFLYYHLWSTQDWYDMRVKYNDPTKSIGTGFRVVDYETWTSTDTSI